MLVTEAIEEYQFAVFRLSPATQQWYLEQLQRFADWCKQNNIPLEKVKPLQTRKYIDYLSATPSDRTDKPLSSYTIHGHARAIRTFL
ncbi:MAG TPA: phage integrase SAM-like domain-containing protein [Ktedonobacteraceae bacterium]